MGRLIKALFCQLVGQIGIAVVHVPMAEHHLALRFIEKFQGDFFACRQGNFRIQNIAALISGFAALDDNGVIIGLFWFGFQCNGAVCFFRGVNVIHGVIFQSDAQVGGLAAKVERINRLIQRDGIIAQCDGFDFAKLSRRRHCMDAVHQIVHKHAACNVLIGGDIP